MRRVAEPHKTSYSNLADLAAGTAAPRDHPDGHFRVTSLTPRQREIAGLLARGLANAEIAEQLVLSTGTVANHVAGILQRLELDSRTQIAAWAVDHGLHGGQDRLLTTLERLLEVQPTTVKAAMDHVANLVAEALEAEKVDAFLHDDATATLVAVGTSETPLGHKQRAAGLDHLAVANGGRVVQVFLTGQSHFDGDVQKDEEELIGIRRELNVRSQVAVPLEMGEVRRGVLTAQSTQPDFFSERDLLFLRAVSRWVANTAQRAELAEHNAAAAIEQGRRMAAEELVTVLAHDLRNHLAPMRGRLDMLHRRAVREEHSNNLRDTADLRRSVARLSRLVSDLLDVARIDQGLLELSPQPTDLAALVREAAGNFEGPSTPIEVAGDAELIVEVDAERVRQALENLLANAVHYSAPGAPVHVRVAQECADARAWAVVWIADHGSGIDPGLLPRLFERFARAPTSAGLGIGLFLTREIALAHGGRIDVASSPQTGTEFILRLPVEFVGPG